MEPGPSPVYDIASSNVEDDFGMKTGAWRVELEPKPGRRDPLGAAARRALTARGLEVPGEVRSIRGFLLSGFLPAETVQRLVDRIFADPITESARILPPGAPLPDGDSEVVVRRHPGVADPQGRSAVRAIRVLEPALSPDLAVESYRAFRLDPAPDPQAFKRAASRALANPTIESTASGTGPLDLPVAPPGRTTPRREVPLRQADRGELARISRQGGLALSLAEMEAIQAHFRAEGREPTDAELETLAQTWSEHCKHKTLTGPVRLQERDSTGRVVRRRRFGNLLKETVFAATERLNPDWCWSVFRDNAGVVALDGDLGVAVKVETHNHPSALEPYGGAGTGIGGVIRDILGTGLGARPFAATDVFCVGPRGASHAELPPGTLHPDRILEGIVSGVRDYGNRMGIPTVCGTVLRHPGYLGNPLVFCGCLGEIPRSMVAKEVRPGDRIVVLGGRTGRDGIHGATFSSAALHEESETLDSTAVQIGDPITEKKVLDALMQARDQGLYRAITDCGAGGFSSAVGEMGEDCGAEVDLSRPLTKYPGLGYAEIWISEAQERMVLAVPPEKLPALQETCRIEEVEATDIGVFTGTGRLVLRWQGEVVGDLPMDFLHQGVPQPELEAEVVRRDLPATSWPAGAEPGPLLLQILAHPSCASKEGVVRQYDHEVQGGTVVKPYQGPRGRGPGDGTVVKPRLDRPAGMALGCGIQPRIGELDAYAGAACAIDEAVRNVVAAGGDPHRLALLDNFCWGDCRKPDRLGSLVRAAEACYDAALAFGAPFISGKDSLNNEYRVGGEERTIPPTLLCTAVAPVADTRRALDTVLCASGNLLALVGPTRSEGGGSVAGDLLGLPDSRPPQPDLGLAPFLVDALHRAMDLGLVLACHDLSEGGLGVAAAEMVFGSGLGLEVDLARVPAAGPLPDLARLFSETPTRFLVEVAPDRIGDFGGQFRALPWAPVGRVLAEEVLRVLDGEREVLSLAGEDLARAAGAGGDLH